MSNKKMVVAGVVVLALVAVVFGFLVWNKGGDEAEAGSPVSFTVNAQGWSEESSSPIPIQVTGETEGKEKVDEKYFLGASDKDLVLKPGSYDVEVYASPVNADGGMYRCPKAVKLSVPKATSKPQSKPSASESAGSEAVASVEFELSPVPANEITDEEIESAQAAMKDAGLSEEEISTFVEAVCNARQAELDRIEAEQKAKEEAESLQKTFGAFAGEYYFDPVGCGACGIYEGFVIDANGNAHGDFDFARMGAGITNSFSITFSNPVPRPYGFEAQYQITYDHPLGGTFNIDGPDGTTYEYTDLTSPATGTAIFYNAGAFQSDSDVLEKWGLHICGNPNDSCSERPPASSVRAIILGKNSDGQADIFFSK